MLRLSVALLTLALCACNHPAPSDGSPNAGTQKSAAPAAASAPVAASATQPAASVAAPTQREGDPADYVPPRPPSDNATQIKAWHILIAYKGAQNAGPSVTRSRDEAKALAEHLDIEARAGMDLHALALKYSDDPQAKLNKGDLGELTRSSMVKPFTDAAFGLLKQEIGVDPVELADGFHIIKRTE
jgi:hypothetical protein